RPRFRPCPRRPPRRGARRGPLLLAPAACARERVPFAERRRPPSPTSPISLAQPRAGETGLASAPETNTPPCRFAPAESLARCVRVWGAARGDACYSGPVGSRHEDAA